jgi:hypothetical protein
MISQATRQAEDKLERDRLLLKSMACLRRSGAAAVLTASVSWARSAMTPLLIPLRRHRPRQLLQLQALRLPTLENRLLKVRC